MAGMKLNPRREQRVPGVGNNISWAAVAAALLVLSSFGCLVAILVQGFDPELAIATGATALWAVAFAVLALGDDG